MKVGDKMLCLNDVCGYDIGGIYYHHIKDNYYKIKMLSKDSIFLETESKSIICGFDFISDTDTKFLFGDYFYTEKELRRLKLKKIYENWR